RRSAMLKERKWRTISFGHDGRQLTATWERGNALDQRAGSSPSSEYIKRVYPGLGTPIQLAISHDGRWLAAAWDDRSVRIWDLEPAAVKAVCRGHEGIVRGVAFHPAGHALLSWGEDCTLRQWSVPDGRALQIHRGHRNRVNDAAYSPDGEWILS